MTNGGDGGGKDIVYCEQNLGNTYSVSVFRIKLILKITKGEQNGLSKPRKKKVKCF